jgi:hypothetical protein
VSQIDATALSNDAILLAFGWFSFGSKGKVTSHPPHDNMTHHKDALAELQSAGLITHEHETHKRLKIDRHHFKGTSALKDMLQHPHAKAVLQSALDARGATS